MQTARRWKFGWCEYVEISRTLYVHDERSMLRGKPLDLLQMLLEYEGAVIPNETLIEKIWGNASRQSLTVAISKLRKVFGGELDGLIQNVASQGYRIAVPVSCVVSEESDAPKLDIKAGDQIPGNANWIAVRRLGGNDHGPVWLGTETGSRNELVFKFATDGIRLRGLQREEAVARIFRQAVGSPPTVRRLERSDFAEAPYYLSGEYVGLSLQQFAETDEFASMTKEDRVLLMAMLANSVAAAHALGILHNDLKPGNILVRQLESKSEKTSVSERYAMVLIDFGDSSLLEDVSSPNSPIDMSDQSVFDTQTGSSLSVGSQMYRAPELWHGGTSTVEADIYALGIVLYQAVTGNFSHVPSAGWQEFVQDPLLEGSIRTAANWDPHKRFRTAAALADELQSLEIRRREGETREADQQRLIQIRRDLDRAHAARPWIWAAIIALVVGLFASISFYRSAVRQRNLAQQENRSLEAMLKFLSMDVLSQSNPSSGIPGSNHAIDLTLSQAISNAIPQIDRRFYYDSLIAGKLHETIADGLRARTQFSEAEQQYSIAAKEYQQAEGERSQKAIVSHLKLDATKMAELGPKAAQSAREDYNGQAKLIKLLSDPEPAVLVLRDFVESGLIGLESDPTKAISPLRKAIALAESTPGFDPVLLIWIRGRFCGLYVRLQDGPHLQEAAEAQIHLISNQYGKDSPMLVSYEMYMQEAYYLEGNYQRAIEQADANYPRFRRLMGDQSQYTLGVLANRAASLAQLGRYTEAIKDDLQLYSSDTPDVRLRYGSLNDAALFACRSGQYQAGITNARRVIEATAGGSNAMPAFNQSSKFVLAECFVGEQETSIRKNAQELTEAARLLNQVDPKMIAQQTGDTGYVSFVALTSARINLLQHDLIHAAQDITRVGTYFSEPGSDPYESREYRRVKAALDVASASHP
jgi:serine/threonine protein kinase/DNA-binding winged helix-turn-helix (wHTH) protein